ncbi:MAG: tetratricopeptide repeat protein [Gemmatimonadaceae bacterium]
MLASSLVAQARSLRSRGEWAEVCVLLEGETGSVGESLELSLILAEAWMRTGRPAEARRLLRDALLDVEGYDPDSALRSAVNLCGAAHFELGELAEAVSAFERALELSTDAADDLVAARATNNLALIANIHGEHDEALARYRTAIPMYQRLGNPVGLAESFHNMAITYRDLNQLEEADEHELRAIEFARQVENERLVAIALVGRAEVALRRGDASMAEATALRAADDFLDNRDPARRADALRLAGVARMARGRHTGARELVEAAVALAHSCGATLIEAECLRARGELSVVDGDRDAAIADAIAAIELFTQLGAQGERDALEAWVLGLRS